MYFLQISRISTFLKLYLLKSKFEKILKEKLFYKV